MCRLPCRQANEVGPYCGQCRNVLWVPLGDKIAPWVCRCGRCTRTSVTLILACTRRRPACLAFYGAGAPGSIGGRATAVASTKVHHASPSLIPLGAEAWAVRCMFCHGRWLPRTFVSPGRKLLPPPLPPVGGGRVHVEEGRRAPGGRGCCLVRPLSLRSLAEPQLLLRGARRGRRCLVA